MVQRREEHFFYSVYLQLLEYSLGRVNSYPGSTTKAPSGAHCLTAVFGAPIGACCLAAAIERLSRGPGRRLKVRAIPHYLPLCFESFLGLSALSASGSETPPLTRSIFFKNRALKGGSRAAKFPAAHAGNFYRMWCAYALLRRKG